MSPHFYIGTSGWYYKHWQTRFYPAEMTKKRWLEFYASHFATVELNNSFYRLPSEAALTLRGYLDKIDLGGKVDKQSV